MHTKIFRLTLGHEEIANQCAKILKDGGIVVFPTETVYGIGADAYNLKAVERIFEIKGRKRDNPLIFHLESIETVKFVAEVKKEILSLFKPFMPGPLTLVLKSKLDKKYTFGLDTIAVRIPDNLIALTLIEKFSSPIVAPSANISGRPSGTEFIHVIEDFDGKVDAIIDGGKTVYGLESTVVDVTQKPFLLLRAGAVTVEDFKEHGINVSFPEDHEVLKRSPGTRYRHYAPDAIVIPFETKEEFYEKKKLYEGEKIAYIGTTDRDSDIINKVIFKDLKEYAAFLYSTFRYFDALGIKAIIAELPPPKGLGLAIRDRIKRASEVNRE